MSNAVNRRFEGRARLDSLLERAGSLADSESVAEAFLKAQQDGVPASVVISALFEDEPRFVDRNDAPALYGNLFGLWDLLLSGERVDLSVPEKAPRPKKPKPPPPPTRFPKEGPSPEWLENAFGYLEACPEAERTRLEHAFENRLDALVTWLDESGATDAVYAGAREVLFELFAMLELGAPAGVSCVAVDETKDEVPPALAAWAQEAVFQAATDEDEPLDPEQSKELGRLVEMGVKALWNGVTHGAQRARR
jgi:hypothetical protein